MTEAPEDRLFERWVRHGDPQALGALFDATALRLLKLAIHIVGDANEAEDVVQATFLAVIEQRTTVDASRPVMPWLSSVLAHKAQQHRRRSARVVDRERLAERAVEDPSRPLERRELDGEVARAIDLVGEPARAVLVLRLRHGMEIADIAHVLERDPSTVRVQLHRGLEKLRGKLPAALATSLVVGWIAPRGLAAMREVVVQEAALATAGAGTSLALGGLIVSKKVLVAAAALLALAAVVWIQQSSGEPLSSPSVAAVPLQVEELERADNSSAPVAATDAPIDAPAAVGGREVTPTSAMALSGRVVDAETQQPIAGVDLRLFEPSEALALDLVREQPELYGLDNKGQVYPHTRGDWPLLVESSAAARFGRGTLLVYGRPSAREEPTAITRSAGDGTFSLPCGTRGGVLEGATPGYATRWRPARAPHEPLTLELWREREFHGVVVDQEDKPVEEPLDLVLTATRQRPSAVEVADADDAPKPGSLVRFDEDDYEGLGSWSTRTDGTGRFRIQVGAPSVNATIVTPGWGRRSGGYQTNNGNEVTVHGVRVPSFHFVDDASGAPIERVHLIGREMANQDVLWSGEFSAPGGRLEMPGEWSYALWYAKATLAFVAWDLNHTPTEVLIPDIASVTTIEMRLKPGVVDALEGVVRKGGMPVAGAEVALLGGNPQRWRIDEDFMVDAAKTSADGWFRLSAAGGSYLLRVRENDAPFLETVHHHGASMWLTRAIAGREPYFQPVSVPADADLVIDLDRTGGIEVEIVDALGLARVEHVVALNAADGRQMMAHTDADGRALFANLPPGRFSLHVPFVSPKGGFSFATDTVREVEVLPRSVERVRIEIPAILGPRHARVEARGVRLYTGWRTRYAGEEWHEIAADGTVPLDLNAGRFELEVRAPDGRRWHPSIPKGAPDGHVIVLDPGTGRYTGRLERDDGTPWAGVAIHAVTWGKTETTPPGVSTISDASGGFELAGLVNAEYRLRFQTETERSVWDHWNNALVGVTFLPSAPPTEAGTRLMIRTGGSVQNVRVHGTVERASGERLANATLIFDCDVPGQHGTLRIGGDKAFNHADERGAFDVQLPRTERITVRVHATTSKPALLTQEFAPGSDDAPLRLVVP